MVSNCTTCGGIIYKYLSMDEIMSGKYSSICKTDGCCQTVSFVARGKNPEYIIADDQNPLNPNGIKEGDRVACDHYMNFPALHGTVVEINEKGLIWVKLDIGGYKETYHPFCKKI